MGLRVIYLTICLLLYMIAIPVKIFSAWTGPQALIQGTWGDGDNQFGFKSGDSGDYFPTSFVVFPDGRIMIDDSINGRSLFYQSNGQLIKAITTEDIFAVALGGFNDGKLVAFDWDDAKQTRRIGVYDLIKEGWSWEDTTTAFPNGIYQVRLYDTEFIIGDGKRGYKYSTTGQLLKTYNRQPAELGIVRSSQKQLEGTYQIRVEYPDVTVKVTASGGIEGLKRDTSSHLFAVAYAGPDDKRNFRVYRYSLCGKTLGFVDIPANDFIFPKFDPYQPRQQTIVNGEYGEPIIASNSDVYTWKRSDAGYSILKWTWQDDPTVPSGPDAPSGLTVTPSTTGLYLAWTASAQDPGCVTGYEIARATTSGGVFSTVGTVAASVLKYNDTTASSGTTYYYKVKAKAGTEYSVNTNEVSGRR